MRLLTLRHTIQDPHSIAYSRDCISSKSEVETTYAERGGNILEISFCVFWMRLVLRMGREHSGYYARGMSLQLRYAELEWHGGYLSLGSGQRASSFGGWKEAQGSRRKE